MNPGNPVQPAARVQASPVMTTPEPAVKAVPVVPVVPGPRELRIYSHSPLFYWWPVWAVGLVMGFITLASPYRMALVPKGTTVETQQDGHETLVLPEGKHLPVQQDVRKPTDPYLHMSPSKNLGVIYATVLLVIILISNAPMRGLWSLLLLLLVLVGVLALALAGMWEAIFDKFSLLDVRINAAGYFFISIVLLIIWSVTVFVFDRRKYVAITSGQVRVCLAAGTGETVYDTAGMTFQKSQNDLFRHWIVGLGSGDLIMHRTNTNQEIDMPNVLFIGSKVREIEQLIKEKEVV